MLKGTRPKHRVTPGTRESERGQMLLLFVAMFTVILALVAFAVDQGFWFGRRRIAQSSADSAARAGAIVYFGIDDANPAPVLSPCKQAALAADDNGIDITNPPCGGDGDTAFIEDDCPGIPGALAVTANIDTTARTLFSGAFLPGSIKIGAESTACAGTVIAMRAYDDDAGPQGIPIVLAKGDSNDCVNPGGVLRVGYECVIWGSLTGANNRLRWTAAVDCGGSPDGGWDQIENGVKWSCTVGDEVGVSEVDPLDTVGQSNVLNGFKDRLARTTTCVDPLEEPGNPASFRDAFGRADGLFAVGAEPPMPFRAGVNPRNSIYVQNNCFDNPRVVIMPFTNNPAGGGGGIERVDGFAIVYITGCYESSSPLNEGVADPDKQGETNDCSVDTLAEPDVSYGAAFTDATEVRGVPVRVFITRGDVGGLGDIADPNAPLAIETVE